MAALTNVRSTKKMSDFPIADLLYLPVAAAAKIWAGAMVAINASGYAVPASSATGLLAVGRAEPGQNQSGVTVVDNTSGANGALSIHVRQGIFKWNNAAGDPIAQLSVGQDAWMTDDNTVSKTDGVGAQSRAGKILQVDTDGVWIDMGVWTRDLVNLGGTIPVYIPALSTLANAQLLLNNVILGYSGRIRKLTAVVATPATTAAKLASIQAQINPGGGAAVSCTGGLLALTSANMTPTGNKVDSSLVTALGTFGPTDGITLLLSAVTAFIEGAALILIELG